MRERLHCDGTQEPNRTWGYFEYPATVTMLLHRVRYGIDVGFASLDVAPTMTAGVAAGGFDYAVGNIAVGWHPPTRVSASVPSAGGAGRAYSFAGMQAGGRYAVAATAATAGACAGAPPPAGGAVAGADGTLAFAAPAGVGCVVTATLS